MKVINFCLFSIAKKKLFPSYAPLMTICHKNSLNKDFSGQNVWEIHLSSP